MIGIDLMLLVALGSQPSESEPRRISGNSVLGQALASESKPDRNVVLVPFSK